MADSFILLSSMSPKIKATTASKRVTKPTKLALKKNIRRSSMFDNRKFTTRHDSVIVIESDPESHNNSEGSIIPDSVCNYNSFEGNCDNRLLNKYLSESVSEINEIKKFSDCDSDASEQNINKLNELNRNMDLDAQQLPLKLNFNKKDDKTLTAKIENTAKCHTESYNVSPKTDNKFSAFKESIINISSSSDIIEDSDEEDKSLENVLDDVYGNSWRNSKKLVFSEPRRNKTPMSIVNLTPTSEVKRSKNIKNNLLEFRHKKLFEDYKKPIKTPLQRNIRALCDSDSERLPLSIFKSGIEKSKVELSFTKNDSIKDNSSIDDFDKLLISTTSIKTSNNKVADEKNKFVRHKKLFEDYKKPFDSPLQANIRALCDSDSDSLPISIFKSDIEKNKVELSFTKNDKDNSLIDDFDKLLIGTTSIKPSNNKVEDEKNKFVVAKKIKKKVKTKKAPILDETEESSDEEVKLITGKPKTKISARRPRKTKKKFFSSETSDSDCKIDSPKGQFSFLASLSKTVKLENCDPSARIFKNNFSTYKIELAKKLFQLYNEKVFNNCIHEDTPLNWNKNMRKTAGFCYLRLIKHTNGSIERKVRIDLSIKVLDSADRLRDTLLHEMCHAAVWIVNEIRDGHGNLFKTWGNKAIKVFPELPPVTTCHTYAINSKYTYRCTNCSFSWGRHSKSIDIEKKRCGYCYGKLELLINKKNKDGQTKTVPVTPKKQPTAFALFVKENYAIYKSPQLNHGQTMKLLGEKFNELKVSICQQ